jgi:gliding motility-associated-like protein
MDNFEKNIKDAVNSYEAPYDAKAWQSLNKKLGPSKGTVITAIIGTAAMLTVLALTFNYYNTKENTIANDYSTVNKLNNSNDIETIQKVTVQNKSSEEYLPEETVENETTKNVETEVKLTVVDENDNTKPSLSNTIPTQVDLNNSIDDNTVDNPSNIDNSTPDVVIGKITELKIVCDNQIKCLSETFVFNSTSKINECIYEWNLGDGTILTGKEVKHKYKSSGNYIVTLTLKDRKTKRIIKESNSLDINVLSEPKTKFNFENIQGGIPQTNFINNTKQSISTQWQIEDIYATDLKEFNYSFRYKGSYNVKLTTTGENGCSSSKTELIKVDNDYNLLAPTAFSPNNDNLNDNFIPKALVLLDLPFTMTIYDRQGRMVFQTNDVNEPWDGLYTKDGIQAPSGLYVWVVQLTNENGEVDVYQNQIMLTK